jgi:enamine deaminase RidA (YjgF/YER057c/UK114 family)
MAFVEGGVEAQAEQALKNMKNVIEASGSEVGKVAKTTVREHTNVPTYETLNPTCRRSSLKT